MRVRATFAALSSLRWQLIISVAVVLVFGEWLFLYKPTLVDIAALDRATYISFASGLASILALFCSVSFGFVLFHIQSSRSERLSAFVELKSRLHDYHSWLLLQPSGKDRDICMSMAFELSKHDLSDLPRTDYGDEYNAYLSALEIGLQDAGSRQFYLISTLYTGYIEQLLSRIGVVSIRQILTEIFVDTLMKGVALVGGLIATLVVALVSFDERTRSLLVLSAIFFAFMAILLFVEFAIAVYRRQREELDFVDWEDTE